MKNKWLFSLVLCGVLQTSLKAQSVTQGSQDAVGPNPNLFVSQQSEHSRVWSKVVTKTNQVGKVFTITNQAYIELATGMSYWNQGQLLDSVESLDVVADGASGTQTRYTVHFMGNANTAGGAVTVNTADNKTFTSRVYGLAYWDSSTGSNVLIGSLQDSQGQLVSSNRLVYPNAFTGCNASIEYIYRKAGLEQNVILESQLPAPASLGLNNDSSRVQVLTEFFAPPIPQKTTVLINGLADDALLEFGDTRIALGQAFLAQGQAQPVPVSLGTVSKHWTQLDNRDFLIEEIPWCVVSNAIQNLPLHASVSPPAGTAIKNTASLRPLLPISVASTFQSGPVQLALTSPAKHGVVIDYSLMSASATNYVFKSDTTYYVSGLVHLVGTNTFEGGTVIKYTYSGADLSVEDASSTFLFNGTSYRPSVFTSSDDNTVGDTISGSSGRPVKDESLYIFNYSYSGPSIVEHARFSYAGYAYVSATYSSPLFKHCQFVDCGMCLDAWPSAGIYLQNILAARCGTVIYEVDTTPICAEHLTVDSCSTFAENGDYIPGGVTNSIFTDVANGTNLTISNSVVASSGSGIYQIVGAGSYYLTNGSANRNAGTTNIDPSLLADLTNMTTYPPRDYTLTILSNNVTLTNYATRDTQAAVLGPDLGYHYEPLDYVFGASYLQGATLTVLPGTAIGICILPVSIYGLWPDYTSSINCQGTPTALNYIVRYNVVQEQSTTNWANSAHESKWPVYYYSSSGPADFRFTEWSVLAGDSHFEWEYTCAMPPIVFQDCQFFGGLAINEMQSETVSNCLFQRVTFTLDDTWQFMPMTNILCNDLFLQCTNNLNHDSVDLGGTWTVIDTLFDRTAISEPYNGMDVTSNNGFVATDTLTPTNAHDVVLSSSPAYQTGGLGQYYYPTNLALVYAGSRTAGAAGLYHYTVTTNNVIEGTNTVSIGFHYIAVDSSGNPLDTDGDGVPDYLKDRNGDGVYDAGDLCDWQNPFNIYDQWVNYGFTPANLRLGYWKFDTVLLTNQAGVAPTSCNDCPLTTDWSGSAVSLKHSDCLLVYPTSSNTTTFLNCTNGTVRLWFCPAWSSGPGGGPGGDEAIIDVGEWTADFSYGLWTLGIVPDGTAIRFLTESNGFEVDYFYAPVNFQANHWYQLALTYSPTNVAFYTNGILLATSTGVPIFYTKDPNNTNGCIWSCGNGISYYPTPSVQATGFSVGSDTSGQTVYGQIDELETFNYPLTAQAVAAGYPSFGGNPTNMQDTYYVGRSDMLQSYVDGVFPPGPTNAANCRLGYWRFDTPELLGEQGQLPKSQSGVTLVPSWSGTAANIGSSSSSQLTYWDVYSNGWANINCSYGAVRFWFKPNGSAFADPAPFVYLGSPNGQDEWSLQLNTSANTISFVTQTNGMGATTVLSASASCLSTTHWTQIVLDYGPYGCSLYLNGVLATEVLGNTNWPCLTNRHLGMVIGNSTAYNACINGQFEEMETFNYQLDPGPIWDDFQIVANVDSDLDGIPDLLEDIQLRTNRPFLGAAVVIAGTVEAEQFDLGGPGIGYHNVGTHPTNSYRPTGMFITNCDDLGGGYCLDQTVAEEWTEYTINVLVPGTYRVETRVEGIGTNGVFEIAFATNGTIYTNTGPLVIPTNIWTNVSAVVTLTSGINVMKLSFLTNGMNNGISGTNVGRFNYISIYPWWPGPLQTNAEQNVFGLISNSASGLMSNGVAFSGSLWFAATNNAIQIQNVISGFPNGGVISIPSGTFYVAQTNPVDLNLAYQNSAMSVVANNIIIEGAGVANTTLIAHNRATTVFSFGHDTVNNNPQCTNLTLRDMTLVAQPHLVFTNLSTPNSNCYELGQLVDNGSGKATGDLVVFYGVEPYLGPWQYTQNILVTNCTFLHAIQSVALAAAVSNCLIRECTFIPWDLTNSFDDTTNTLAGTTTADTTNYAGQEVGIMGGGNNIVIVENTYTNIGTVANTNNFQLVAPDGFVWLQSGGNAFIGRNVIGNYSLEGIQLDAGPTAVVGNTYCTVVSDFSACALSAGGTTQPGLTGTSNDYATCFIGNWVQGGRNGECWTADPVHGFLPFTLNFSGNYLNLFRPFNQYWDHPGAAVIVSVCQSANIFGNTLAMGSCGVLFGAACTNGAVVNNDFGNVSYGGIGLAWAAVASPSLQNAQIFRNILGQGLTYHTQVSYPYSFDWFLNQNQYVNGPMNVPPFLDPAACSAQVSN